MEKQRCSVTILGERVLSWQCLKMAIVIRNGKAYCKIHDPEYIKAKDKERNAKWDKERAERYAKWDREELIEGIFEGIDTETIRVNIDKYKAIV